MTLLLVLLARGRLCTHFKSGMARTWMSSSESLGTFRRKGVGAPGASSGGGGGMVSLGDNSMRVDCIVFDCFR